jgi:hypothetical protein
VTFSELEEMVVFVEGIPFDLEYDGLTAAIVLRIAKGVEEIVDASVLVEKDAVVVGPRLIEADEGKVGLRRLFEDLEDDCLIRPASPRNRDWSLRLSQYMGAGQDSARGDKETSPEPLIP